MPKTVARFKAGPALLYHSRTSITSSTTESGIDLLLKDLRALSKHLNKSFVHFAEELQVLDQLYYKGTNQHRHALFWRHTAEMRKYAHRIHGFGISDLIDTLRYAFFPEGAQSNPKILKGTWTRCPDSAFLFHVEERLLAASALVGKAHERFQTIYESLLLVLQSGYFLQLIVVLVAIVAKLDTIALEIVNDLFNVADVVRRGTQTLNATLSTQPISSTDSSSYAVKSYPSRPESITPRQQPTYSKPQATSLTGRQTSGVVVNRKKRKKDEIDDIFGF